MVKDKEIIRKEIKSAIRNISILLISLVIINLGFSIASLFNFTEDRLVWTIDYGFFSIVLSVLFTIIHYCLIQKKLFIEVNLQNKKEEINKITITHTEFAEIKLMLHIKGEYKKLSKPIIIVFPYWIDYQLKPKPYIKEYDDENKCEIDLDYLIKNKKDILLNETIIFDIISNIPGEQDDVIKVLINYGYFKEFFLLHIKNQGIIIKNKGG